MPGTIAYVFPPSSMRRLGLGYWDPNSGCAGSAFALALESIHIINVLTGHFFPSCLHVQAQSPGRPYICLIFFVATPHSGGGSCARLLRLLCSPCRLQKQSQSIPLVGRAHRRCLFGARPCCTNETLRNKECGAGTRHFLAARSWR